MDQTRPPIPETASCWAVLALGVTLAGVVAGCRLQMCNDRIDASARYRVTVVDLYNAQSMFTNPDPIGLDNSCAGIDGLAVGNTFELQAHGTVSTVGCMLVLADIVSGVGQATVLGPPETVGGIVAAKKGSGFMTAGAYVATSSGDGDLILELRPGGGLGGIYATPVPGQYPPLVLDRSFYSSNNSQTCLDEFVVQLDKE
jgi:hypothetical protein